MPTLLVANRGEIALRIMRTARQEGYCTVAIYSDADRDAAHVVAADLAVPIGGNTPQESYLDIGKILDAAQRTGADCIHPGYGFLSENAQFARACEEAGLSFIGPSADVIELMGNKRQAKTFALAAGVPCIPGYEGAQDLAELQRQAARIGYPVMLKAAAGGGGRGMRVVQDESDFSAQLMSARKEALSAFGNDEIILEKALSEVRHIEIQIFADTQGNCIHLGERDCSIQRRHQKVVEEAPSPILTPALRQTMGKAATALAQACGYTNAGTVEFLLDSDGQFYFLEMNTRLQVEHGVTELITGTDLVAWQLAIARGESLPICQDDVALHGHAIEVRLYAEDPERDFLPQSGKILYWQHSFAEDQVVGSTSPAIRFDHALATGITISPYYDPMLGKLMAWGKDRNEARRRLSHALQALKLLGPQNNRAYLKQIIDHPVFAAGSAHTGFLEQQFSPAVAGSESVSRAHALACALLHHARIPAMHFTSGAANWQSGHLPLSREYRLSDGIHSFAVTLCATSTHHYTVTLTAEIRHTITLTSIANAISSSGELAVSIDDVIHPVLFHIGDKQLSMLFEQRLWSFTDETYMPVQPVSHSGTGLILAPMDGCITQICIEPGATVESGSLLATMEAMKMEHALRADGGGIVTRVNAYAGDQVHSGQLIIEIEQAG
ncbi:acetyl/propionyl/methylcrotonyl-CoA carboxylase subunit alpha [Microbulbifer pacificus]|uniref:Biotin carboxylase n=1 Tax=Microbulbifer pacificus TaxID=407164 RepID=A0AAU0MYM8_9GAMM|nr:biotin carboxylase N-terminal domain-containing protein [Microbulbifer pacificus]WOX05812.1 biotin carboxylase N-terminal domain-containing protein [Microbulbifer pacificus]